MGRLLSRWHNVIYCNSWALHSTVLLRPEVMELWITEASSWSIKEEKCFNLNRNELGGITLIIFHWQLVGISLNISTWGASQKIILSLKIRKQEKLYFYDNDQRMWQFFTWKCFSEIKKHRKTTFCGKIKQHKTKALFNEQCYSKSYFIFQTLRREINDPF